MFSRIFLSVFAASVLASFTSCSLYEGPPAQRKESFQGNSLDCMKDFRAKLLDYVDGNATREDVQRLSDCSIKALQTFGEFTKGENRDRFTAEEVRNFLQRYFLEDVVISDALLKELMRVKQAFLGGKSGDFSRDDLKSAQKMIETFRDILLRLQPAMPFSFARVERESPAYVDASGQALIDAAGILGQAMTEKRTTYSFEDMGRLFDEIMLTFKGSKGVLSSVRGQLKLAGLLKEMIISPYRPREVVTAAEWRIIFQEGSQWAATYFRFINMSAQYSDWMRGEGRARLGHLLAETLAHLDRAIARHCPDDHLIHGGCNIAPGIPIASLKSLIGALDWDGQVLGVKFRKATIQTLLDPIIKRLLAGPDLKETGRNTNRLTSAHVDRLRSLVGEWIDGSRFVEGVFASLVGSETFAASVGVSTEALLRLNAEKVLQENGGVTPAARNEVEALRELFKGTIALTDRGSRGAVFDGKNAIRLRSYQELDRYTWMRPVFKRIVLGYISGDNRVARAKSFENDGLTVEEFTAFIRDIWQPLTDFKLVGPKNSPDKDGKRRFREASLFTQVSDGNEVVSLNEGIQLVLFMFSVSPLSTEIHARAGKLCPKGPLDDYGQPTIEPMCYRTKIYDFSDANTSTSDLWKQFPLLMKFYNGLDPEDQDEFRAYVESVSRKPTVTPETWFSSDDSQTTPMMFHYIEQLFQSFDKNGDGMINREEAEKAYPLFQSTLFEMSGKKVSGEMLKSVFFYLLSHGQPPIDETKGWLGRLVEKGDFLAFHLRAHDIEADRLSVLKVFATLAKAK